MVCDGKKWFAFSNNLSGQAVLRDAPQKITLPMLQADQTLNQVLNNGFAGGSPQLLLLLEEKPLPAPEPTPAPVKPAVAAWNPAFNEVSVPVTGTWQGLKVAAREVLNLKVGDVLRLDPGTARQIIVRLGGHAKFQGRPGVVSGQWAVELTDFFRP